MKQLSWLWKFLIIFALSYGALMFLVQLPGVDQGIHTFFRKTSEKFIATVMPKAYISSEPATEGSVTDHQTMLLVFGNKETVQREIAEARRQRQAYVKVSTFSTRFFLFQFYTVPLIFFISLIIATPMPKWRSKLLSLLIGVAALMAFFLTKLYIFTLFTISKGNIGVYELGHEWTLRLRDLSSVLTLGFSIILAVFLWFLVAFRKSTLMLEVQSFFARK